MSAAPDLSGGFPDPARDAARAFRAALNAMARPGRIETVDDLAPPAPMSPAAAALVVVLCDPDTGLFLAPSHDTPAIRDWIRFHASAPFVAPEAADFALGPWDALVPLSRFRAGVPEYPDRSATLIVETDALTPPTHSLTGPGIETEALARLPETGAFAENRKRFPLGLDFFFTAGNALSALPRSTTLTEIA